MYLFLTKVSSLIILKNMKVKSSTVKQFELKLAYYKNFGKLKSKEKDQKNKK